MNRLKRETGRSRRDEFKQQREIICICTEGTVTERSYLECVERIFKKKLKNQGDKGDAKVSFNFVRENKKTSPTYLVNRMRKKQESLTNKKIAGSWIISDKDQWSREQLNEIKTWVDEDNIKRHWILSNPKIEYWFDLHFQNDADKQDFYKRYNKEIKDNDFTYEQIVDACAKARAKKQKLDDLYTQCGSLMYKIVEYIGERYELCFEKDSRGYVKWKRL